MLVPSEREVASAAAEMARVPLGLAEKLARPERPKGPLKTKTGARLELDLLLV